MSRVDLHALPKIRDGWSYLYVEHCQVDQESKAIVLVDARGRVPVPCATLALLMLGPGTSITHAAIRALADNGCLAAWCGEEGVRFYAQGLGRSRNARNTQHQARLWADPHEHLAVVYRLYQARFGEALNPALTLQQIRGMEGARVRKAYEQAAREYGVNWQKRSYDRGSWAKADPVNRALSTANSCLYGVCHAAIVAAGYSTALGFIHVGRMLSFVYDVADLYKTEVAIPVAFREAADASSGLDSRVRRACRDAFHEARLLGRIVSDIQRILGGHEDGPPADDDESDDERFPAGLLWSPEGDLPGGVNFAETEVEEHGHHATGEGSRESEGRVDPLDA